jgi:hypothetical protein
VRELPIQDPGPGADDRLMDRSSTAARSLASGSRRIAAGGAPCAFAYEETEVTPGLTLEQWRRARSAPRRRSLWIRLVRRG